jgi:four helix bundle protein
MENENIVQQKSYNYAIRIIKLYQYLAAEKKEYELSKQILRSGTSIGANIEEAIGDFPKKIFSQNWAYPIVKREKRTIGFDY